MSLGSTPYTFWVLGYYRLDVPARLRPTICAITAGSGCQETLVMRRYALSCRGRSTCRVRFAGDRGALAGPMDGPRRQNG
jgi:hypothetical protein